MEDVHDSSITDGRASLSAVGPKINVMGSPSTLATETTLGPSEPVFKEFSQEEDEKLLADYLPLFGNQQQVAHRVFHWEIDSWAGLSSTAHSPPFMIAQNKFQIHLEPNTAEPHTLFRLACEPADNDELCVYYCLAISNAECPEVCWKRAIQHRYMAETMAQGSQEIVEHSLLTDAMPDYGRPVIENDYVRISVYIRIIKDRATEPEPESEPMPARQYQRTQAVRKSIMRTKHINSVYSPPHPPPPQMIRVRIITDQHTRDHQEFDIFDFDSPDGFEMLLPRTHQVSELLDTYRSRTEAVGQMDLWILNRRDTGTLRCSHPIEVSAEATLGDLVDMHSFSSDLAYFYCERHTPGLAKPGLTNLIHIKFYDAAADKMVGLGHLRLSFFKKTAAHVPRALQDRQAAARHPAAAVRGGQAGRDQEAR
ncbi:hypothetical protein DL89DRAFT_259195 [Linderina pennispora]|uniref:Uncharacterized protein n=1 Tax=Linderina pennispora TaxID=61395 RepID=A0A1Y1W3T3_9FUNG|nr:uncharacterized protein DL89DRAFT_259195 [Linderina pennispora]ORX67965.1 hypothetical protein DL89DRAFT_259195 [Linderina pennispora]